MPDADRRLLLAIDTSTAFASVAVYDGIQSSELSWPASRDQTVSVLAEVNHLLELNGRAADDLGAVATATGPGMFSGLRVGIGLAKGLVLGLQIPLIGISTLEATALPYLLAAQPVMAVVTAGRGRLVWGEYGNGKAMPPRNGTLDELLAQLAALPAPPIVAGELSSEQEARLAAAGTAILPPRALGPRRAGAVASLAWDRWQRGEVDDPVRLEPMYAHR